jgi:hypothetical protein
MKPGLTISCIGHAGALLLGLLAISAQPMQAPPMETLPVEFISATDFSKLTQGVKNAPRLKMKEPKPLADKVDQPKPVKQLAPKVADKPEITTETAASKPQPKPDPKPADKRAKKTADFKPDQIAELLKKDEAKKPPKPQHKPAPEKPAHARPKFDANQVAALLDKRDPRRHVATAETLNNAPSLGAATGAQDAQLSQSEIDALRERIRDCWSPPAGVDPTSDLYVTLRVLFKPDGSLAQAPDLVAVRPSPLAAVFAESAQRALLMCQPFTMLKPEHYDQWKDIEFTFTPHELLGG